MQIGSIPNIDIKKKFKNFIIEKFLFYFLTTSLIVFILCIAFWIRMLFSTLMNSTIEMYQKLKYDIISGKITEVKVKITNAI